MKKYLTAYGLIFSFISVVFCEQHEALVLTGKVLKKEEHILGNWAKTKSGKWLGQIEDVLINIRSFRIVKYYIRGTAISFRFQPFIGTFRENRIIPATEVIKITSKVIIVKDDKKVEKEEVKATVPEPA